MLRSTRAALAVGLGCVGVAGLVGQSSAQQDTRVTKVAAGAAGSGAAPAPVAMPPASIGTIDVERVFREYDKVKVAGENLNAEVGIRFADLTKLANEGKQKQEELSHMAPGRPDAKKLEEQIVQLQADIQAKKQMYEREFTQKETETMTQIYNEVTTMARGVANQRGMTFIVKYSDAKVEATEPNSAMAAMSRTIVYADPATDITNKVIEFLNYKYKAAGGKAPQPLKAAAPAVGTTPTPATRTAAPAPTGR